VYIGIVDLGVLIFPLFRGAEFEVVWRLETELTGQKQERRDRDS
jgi:hypothetical protein